MTERTTRSRIRFRPLFGLGLLLFAFTASVRGADDLPPNYYHDFRGRPLPAELTRFQVNDDKLLQFEPRGLRITFPKTYGHPLGGVGVETAAGLKGDFDITATVEVLSLEPPKGGPGAGVGLSVDAATKQEQLRRVVGPRGKHSILCTGYVQPPQEKRPLDWKQPAAVPCEDSLLRLRLKRTGATLHFLWAPGPAGDDFVALHEKDFGKDDIEHVRLFAMNGRQPCTVDVRLIDLRILSGGQAAALPLPVEKPQKTEKDDTKAWLVAGLIVGLALIVALAVGAWLVMRLRRRADTTVAAADGNDKQLLIACSACGKKIKAKAERAGKTVKCSQCGKAVKVPTPPEDAEEVS